MGGKKGGENAKKAAGNARVCNPAPAFFIYPVNIPYYVFLN
mgnify:CR=1 FL=1